MTTQEINRINSTRSAVSGKRYVDEEGNTYLGNKTGKLQAMVCSDMIIYPDNSTLQDQAIEQSSVSTINTNLNTYISGISISSPSLVVLIGSLIFPFVITNELHYGKCVGLAVTSASASGQIVKVQSKGECDTGVNIYIPGALYYASTNGSISLTPPLSGIIQTIGIAKDTRTIILELQQPLISI